MAFFLLVANAFYSMELFSSGTADMRGFFGLLPLFFLFFVPAIYLLIAKEHRAVETGSVVEPGALQPAP